MTFHNRSDWTDAPGGCATELTATGVRGVVLHWPGATLHPDLERGGDPQVRSWLNQTRTEDLNDPKYDYCDIQYNLAVDQSGDVWAARGLTARGGANGTTEANTRYVSIVCLYSVGSKPSEQMVDGIRDAIRRVRERYPNAKAIKGHRNIIPTACPGDPLYRLIQDGQLDPRAAHDSRIRRRIRKVRGRIRDLKDLLARLVRKVS